MPLIFIHQPMEKCCAAARVADDKNRLPDFLLVIARKQDFIEQEKKPVDKLRGDVEEQPDDQNQRASGRKMVMLASGLEKGFEIVTKKGTEIKIHLKSPPPYADNSYWAWRILAVLAALR